MPIGPEDFYDEMCLNYLLIVVFMTNFILSVNSDHKLFRKQTTQVAPEKLRTSINNPQQKEVTTPSSSTQKLVTKKSILGNSNLEFFQVDQLPQSVLPADPAFNTQEVPLSNNLYFPNTYLEHREALNTPSKFSLINDLPSNDYDAPEGKQFEIDFQHHSEEEKGLDNKLTQFTQQFHGKAYHINNLIFPGRPRTMDQKGSAESRSPNSINFRPIRSIELPVSYEKPMNPQNLHPVNPSPFTNMIASMIQLALSPTESDLNPLNSRLGGKCDQQKKVSAPICEQKDPISPSKPDQTYTKLHLIPLPEIEKNLKSLLDSSKTVYFKNTPGLSAQSSKFKPLKSFNDISGQFVDRFKKNIPTTTQGNFIVVYHQNDPTKKRKRFKKPQKTKQELEVEFMPHMIRELDQMVKQPNRRIETLNNLRPFMKHNVRVVKSFHTGGQDTWGPQDVWKRPGTEYWMQENDEKPGLILNTKVNAGFLRQFDNWKQPVPG